MIRTWTGPIETYQDTATGLWQAIAERDDRQHFYYGAVTEELARAGLAEFLDDEKHPMLPSTRVMLDNYERKHGHSLPPRWYPKEAS